jgi:hypothetical protein
MTVTSGKLGANTAKVRGRLRRSSKVPTRSRKSHCVIAGIDDEHIAVVVDDNAFGLIDPAAQRDDNLGIGWKGSSGTADRNHSQRKTHKQFHSVSSLSRTPQCALP